MPIKALLACAAFFLLTACIIVDDFGDYWAQGFNDPCLNDIGAELYQKSFEQAVPTEQSSDYIRAVRIGETLFFLIKKSPEDAGGHAYYFDVESGILNVYRPDPAQRHAFEAAYPNAMVELDKDTARLKILDANNSQLLASVARKEQFWNKDSSYIYNQRRSKECLLGDHPIEE